MNTVSLEAVAGTDGSVSYGDYFADAIAELHERFAARDAEMVGAVPVDGWIEKYGSPRRRYWPTVGHRHGRHEVLHPLRCMPVREGFPCGTALL